MSTRCQLRITSHQPRITNHQSRHLVRELLNWFSANARDLPWRRTQDPYAIWVSEIMLQQTQVKTVMPYWQRWLRALPDVDSLAKAKQERVLKLWEGLGYYTRARNMQRAAQIVSAKHEGRFPDRFDDVLALPGIGRYTAGAICSIAFNQPTPILDGNVIRVLTRLFTIEGDPRGSATNKQLWKIAEQLITAAAASDYPSQDSNSKSSIRACSLFNQSLMELGALICTARRPQCQPCPVSAFCLARKKGVVEHFPNFRARAATMPRRFWGFVLQDKDRFLARQRPSGLINAHLWEFPSVEIHSRAARPDSVFRRAFRTQPLLLKRLCVIRHSITRYRIVLEAFHTKVPHRPRGLEGRWLTRKELDAVTLSAAHRRVLDALTA